MNEVTFTEKEFEVLRKFQNKMNAVFGETAYVGTNYAMVMLDYSPKLVAMLRPYPTEKHFTFEVKLLPCKDCTKTALYLCLTSEESYFCDACLKKRMEEEAKKAKAEAKKQKDNKSNA
jgi:hypothetical protein